MRPGRLIGVAFRETTSCPATHGVRCRLHPFRDPREAAVTVLRLNLTPEEVAEVRAAIKRGDPVALVRTDQEVEPS